MKISKANVIHIVFIILGSCIMATATNGILIPHQLLSGGIAGIAIFLHIVTGWETSILVMLFNIPIFILGYRFVNKQFVLYSFIGTTGYSIFLALTRNFVFPTNDMLNAILLGGVLGGLGSGIVFRGHGSTGGTDIVAKIFNRYFSFSIGSVMFVFNLVVIAISAFSFGLDLAINTLATMFISSQTMTYVIEGLNYKRTVFIISEQHEVLADAIMRRLNRGVTFLLGEGAYTKAPRRVLYCTIGIRQVAKLKDIVREIDPNAFVTITETAQVFGKGFFDIKNL